MLAYKTKRGHRPIMYFVAHVHEFCQYYYATVIDLIVLLYRIGIKLYKEA